MPMSSTARTTWGDDVPPTDKAAPSTLLAGRYRIGALLGSGGSGQVHRAVDRLTGQDVAVKLVRLRFDRGWNRLRREIAALRHARLPGIVRLRDDGPTDDGWYLAMDLAAGAAFPGRAGPMPWTELRPLVLRLLEILLPMHCAGLVHRDIKPANVLVDPATGAITVVDLGLARGTALRAGPAESYFEGTPAYAPPEQVIGAEVDARGDLYAVGIMAWEALLGWRPRQTDTAGVEVPTAPASLASTSAGSATASPS